MVTAIIILLILWAILTVVGFVFKGLLWLAYVGIILFIGTSILGFVRRHSSKRHDVS